VRTLLRGSTVGTSEAAGGEIPLQVAWEALRSAVAQRLETAGRDSAR
jgi:hypothetical protein